MGCVDVGDVCLVSDRRPCCIVQKRGNRVVKCQNKTGRSCIERTPLRKQSGRTEVNLGRDQCVFVRERGAESQLPVSLFPLFLVILLPLFPVILSIFAFCCPALFLSSLDIICPLCISCFSHLFLCRFSFPLVSSTTAPYQSTQ